MKFSKLLLAPFVFGFFGFAYANTSKSQAQSKAQGKLDLVSYNLIVGSFGTLGNLVEGFSKVGLLSPDDTNALLSYYEKQNVPLNSKIGAGKVEGNKMTWGRYSLTRIGEREYKTNTGSLIQLQNETSAQKKIEKIAKAFESGKYSIIRLVAEPSYAIGDERLAAAISATFSLDNLENTVRVFSTPIGLVFGAAGALREGMLFPIRKFILDGQVECDGDKYLVTNGFAPNNLKEAYFEARDYCQKIPNLSGSKRQYDDISSLLCGFTMSGYDYWSKSFEDRANKVIVTDEWLKKMYKGPVPACTKDNAILVQSVLKEHGEELFKNKSKAKTQGTQANPSNSNP